MSNWCSQCGVCYDTTVCPTCNGIVIPSGIKLQPVITDPTYGPVEPMRHTYDFGPQAQAERIRELTQQFAAVTKERDDGNRILDEIRGTIAAYLKHKQLPESVNEADTLVNKIVAAFEAARTYRQERDEAQAACAELKEALLPFAIAPLQRGLDVYHQVAAIGVPEVGNVVIEGVIIKDFCQASVIYNKLNLGQALLERLERAEAIVAKLVGRSDSITMALAAIGAMKDGVVMPWNEVQCRCDASVGMAPCEYCAMYYGLIQINSLITQARAAISASGKEANNG